MADKKVSTLTERSTRIDTTDLIMIVGNTATTATNYKVQAVNFFSKAVLDLPIASEAAALKITANLVGNGTVVQAAGELRLNAGNTSIASGNLYGFIISHSVANASSNAYGSPVAFLGFKDDPAANVKTTYLFEAGLGSNGSVNNYVTANLTQANASVLICKANTTTAAAANSIPATHQIRCRINGADYWLLASNVAPA